MIFGRATDRKDDFALECQRIHGIDRGHPGSAVSLPISTPHFRSHKRLGLCFGTPEAHTGN